MKYITQKEADEVLDYYENFFMSIESISYVAVVENPSCHKKHGYSLEIGSISINSVKIKDIKVFNSYIGNWGENIIPKYLPIPSKYESFLKNQYNKREIKKVKFDNHELVSINKIEFKPSNDAEIYSKKNLFIFDNYQFNIKNNIEKEWIDYPLGTHLISGERTHPGTLGGIFRLIEYPNNLFGITNWHVLVDEKTTLGDPVYSVKNNGVKTKIGELFWYSLDIDKEVSFIKFSTDTTTALLTRFPEEKLGWILDPPKIGMKVKQRGNSTYESQKKFKESEIISTNATIKKRDTLFPNKVKIFKHQILIINFHKSGDSGALVLTKTQNNSTSKAVGLLFSEVSEWNIIKKDKKSPEEKNYSAANNLSRIFNYKFSNKKEIFHRKETEGQYSGDIHLCLAQRFTLAKNFQF